MFQSTPPPDKVSETMTMSSGPFRSYLRDPRARELKIGASGGLVGFMTSGMLRPAWSVGSGDDLGSWSGSLGFRLWGSLLGLHHQPAAGLGLVRRAPRWSTVPYKRETLQQEFIFFSGYDFTLGVKPINGAFQLTFFS